MISSNRPMSREGVMARFDGDRPCGPYKRGRDLSPPDSRGCQCQRANGARRLMARPLGLPARLKQEPAALFRFVDEHLEEACGCYVFVLVGELVGGAHVAD